MTRLGLLALSVFVLFGSAVAASTVVDAGVTQLAANSATPQPVAINAQGDGVLTGFNLRAQIGDGVGPANEPVFDSVDFTGGLWNAHPNQSFGGPVDPYFQLAQASVVFETSGDTVVPGTTSLVATPRLTTLGISEGVFDLNLSSPPDIGQGSEFVAVGGGPVSDVWINDGKLFIVGPNTLLWSGGAGSWSDSSWSNGSGNVSPSGGEAVVLTSGSVTVGDARNANSVTLSNAALNIAAAGQLQVAGQVYTGQSSTLNVNGTLNSLSSDVFLAAGYPDGSTPGGTLSGAGTVIGDVTQAGTVAPGNSIDTLTIDGDAVFATGAILQIELSGNDTDGTTTNDVLAVTGTLDLTAPGERMTLDWLPGTDATSMFGGDYVVATAGTLVGEFALEDIGGGNIGDAYIAGISHAGDQVTVSLYDLIMADANLDGEVDLQDFGLLKDNFGQSGDWFSGNFNFDPEIDLQDFGLLKDNFGAAAGMSPVLSATAAVLAVPEPGSCALLLGASAFGLLWLLKGRPQRREE